MMVIQASITKSKAGHYTARVYKGNRLIYLATKLPSLYEAHAAIRQFRELTKQ